MVPEGIGYLLPGEVVSVCTGRPLHPRDSLPFLSMEPPVLPQPGRDVQHHRRLRRLHTDVERPEVHRQPLLHLPRHRLSVRRRHRLYPLAHVRWRNHPGKVHPIVRALVLRPIRPERRADFRPDLRFAQALPVARFPRICGPLHRACHNHIGWRFPHLLHPRGGIYARRESLGFHHRGDTTSLDRRHLAGPQAFRRGGVSETGRLHYLLDRRRAGGRSQPGKVHVWQPLRPLPECHLVLPGLQGDHRDRPQPPLRSHLPGDEKEGRGDPRRAG